MKKLFAALALAAVVAPVWAATQTVTLSVPGMTCASCPITVKHALSKVEGVSKTDVSFDKRQAVVTFDDAKTNVQKLTKATEDAAIRPASNADPLTELGSDMGLITRIAGKTGALGSVVSAMGCAACFPAIASFGAAIGLGFLSQYEGLFIGILLPMFAGIALLANAIAWLNHRQWRRTALGTIGPILVLAAVFLMRAYGWQSGGLLYVGLALMVGVSVWDFISPAHRRCGPDSCELPEQRG
jgi:mercuric ion transport protein